MRSTAGQLFARGRPPSPAPPNSVPSIGPNPCPELIRLLTRPRSSIVVFRETINWMLGNVTHSPNANSSRNTKIEMKPPARPVIAVAQPQRKTPAPSTTLTS